jgi:hypothetical protein
MSIDIESTLSRIESRLDSADALADVIDSWTARSLAAAPPVSPETQARLARLLAEGEDSA